MDIRKAQEVDLEAMNNVITDGVMQWDLPDRVRHLALSSFHYDALDLQYMDIQVAVDEESFIVGVVACEATDSPDEILLHGIFVRPNEQRKGLGKLLLRAVEQGEALSRMKKLLVKPQKEALNFFRGMGFERVMSKSNNQYENLMSKTL
ncbi:MAG: GNAT family N-acetyltransferase [uncultured Thiotrichaceae bacterium]|uniref:GNAT family N-acetyltransferase n=1 Tax=uncultured Thiotrichaceae bacterium TaxID=298394 RepID=A0A6S6SNG3_9GAMM|nr:MAG: GNAT family N-acetyltransferase [uncultured Thiotrichaceae bacterium]